MSYARTNDATEANIDTSKIFASGTFKNVWVGTYTDGRRAGQACVCKEFKTGSVYEERYFRQELKVIRRTQKTLDEWHAAGIIDRQIYLNTPSVWEYELTGVLVLIEPMIENFEKFNSNSGWAQNTGPWGDAMQALSHFSYHKSLGQLLLCDLQGGIYRDG
ncbi:hypothetical protein PVAG01_00207 [Phlyctema vagabunda]|uniref:Alpha-type protein kinase domain-containing protein n=1 Tax=Phlyctema vagabunda TaxID=108571 RepID=A0ABR4PU20_9HELO